VPAQPFSRCRRTHHPGGAAAHRRMIVGWSPSSSPWPWTQQGDEFAARPPEAEPPAPRPAAPGSVQSSFPAARRPTGTPRPTYRKRQQGVTARRRFRTLVALHERSSRHAQNHVHHQRTTNERLRDVFVARVPGLMGPARDIAAERWNALIADERTLQWRQARAGGGQVRTVLQYGLADTARTDSRTEREGRSLVDLENWRGGRAELSSGLPAARSSAAATCPVGPDGRRGPGRTRAAGVQQAERSPRRRRRCAPRRVRRRGSGRRP
jgi:hypothetical protein